MKYAVCMGHLDAVQLLEKMTGKPVEGKFLADAASAGNIPLMAYILEHGADIRTDGANAMAQAVLFYDQPEAARFLLHCGANPNQFTCWRKCFLSEAQSASMVKVLLEAGANPNSEDQWGTPLSAAPDAESVRLLVRYGANLHPRLLDGISLIESAVIHDRRDKPDVVRELIRLGATFDPQGNGIGALALAAARDKVETMKCLLDMGVNPNAFVNAPYLQTSVMRSAVIKSSMDAVRLLLEQGGTPLGNSRDGITPSSLALLSGDEDMANLLREGGARDVGDLSLAAAFGDLKEVRDLITAGADVNQRDQAGHTPLFYALRYRQTVIARFLMQHGAVVPGEEISQGSR
jgi:ankyrin repeat protein